MISCDQHDYIEIACLYQLELELSFSDGRQECVIAKDTGFNKQRQECLIVLDSQRHTREIAIDELASMRATEVNPHFSEIVFTVE